MPIARANTQLSGRRPLVIVAMMLASLMLIGVLGWHSWKLQKSNAAAAETVLREYAILVADEYARRSTAAIGYRGYFQIVSRFDRTKTAEAMLDAIRQDDELGFAADLVDGFFTYDGRGLSAADFEVTPALRVLIHDEYIQAGERRGPYHSARTASGRQQIIFTVSPASDESPRMYGFSIDSTAIGHVLQDAFEMGPLLPPSLAGGRLGNDMLFARFIDPADQTLFEINPQYDSTLTITKVLVDDYQGVLEGFILKVSVDPGAAAALIIGGLPGSRTPLLIGVMVMTVLLMLSAIWLFRREHAVMALRSDFMSQVSHELRTPLTQIRMFAETLLLDRTRNEEERRRSLEIIDRESRRLSHLVDNILRFSNISDAAQIDRHWQTIAPVVREVCDTMSMTSGTAIDLSVDDTVKANVNSDALRQVILNLLDNAMKFGPRGQRISVSVSGTDEAALISIGDQGPGIPVEERERVWSAFYRMKREEDSAVSGTGIGLSVVRELVDAMHGRCRIDSAKAGTRVIIEFGAEEGDA